MRSSTLDDSVEEWEEWDVIEGERHDEVEREREPDRKEGEGGMNSFTVIGDEEYTKEVEGKELIYENSDKRKHKSVVKTSKRKE